ncbi:substrate-binding domain-containing protein [Streptomyces sp. NBC_01283]|uniref:substrate-binding domain-containing protein n=1 Tax=Streptomyces sp. NBC_01283 TaxID=2903812 RepID=UPI00352FDF49|nr:substrate-binding domain-containing protein [Streptomyces sp. NBC_01283]
MNWLSTENIIAVLAILVGIAGAFVPVLLERRVPRRKRIGYRKQMDTAIGDNVRTGDANARLGLFDEAPEMSDATLVLLRVENDGSLPIDVADYTGRSPHGLTAVFEHRTIRAVAVTLPPEADHLMEHFAPGTGLGYESGRLHIPRVPLNRGEYYKLLVLLTGGPVDSDYTVVGGIQGGETHENHSAAPDEKPPVFSRLSQRVAIALSLVILGLAGLILRPDTPPPPSYCEKGSLTLTGSTAFEPVATELADKYMKDCEGSDIAVSAHGSRGGVRELAASDTGPGKGSPPVIAFSDGPRPASYSQLSETRVAVSLFALVLNEKVPVKNLSTTDVRRLFTGEIRNWKELRGGPDLPVVLVSRGSSSGTRVTLQHRVLKGAPEIQESSSDCLTKDIGPRAPVIRCELDSTEQVLDTVATTPGAIGYSELRNTTTLKGMHRLTLDGHAPSVDHIQSSGYPYREIEYAYTYGSPPADSLASSFLAYAIRGNGQDVVRTHGHLPCQTPVGLRMCGAG